MAVCYLIALLFSGKICYTQISQLMDDLECYGWFADSRLSSKQIDSSLFKALRKQTNKLCIYQREIRGSFFFSCRQSLTRHSSSFLFSCPQNTRSGNKWPKRSTLRTFSQFYRTRISTLTTYIHLTFKIQNKDNFSLAISDKDAILQNKKARRMYLKYQKRGRSLPLYFKYFSIVLSTPENFPYMILPEMSFL